MTTDIQVGEKFLYGTQEYPIVVIGMGGFFLSYGFIGNRMPMWGRRGMTHVITISEAENLFTRAEEESGCAYNIDGSEIK